VEVTHSPAVQALHSVSDIRHCLECLAVVLASSDVFLQCMILLFVSLPRECHSAALWVCTS
jgi:hypothetical protein